ncbi:hypothetical protein NBE98_09785 [Clostridium swellfunianum]|uniref:hypothetical protein n=1 Tax=Clostridium swellfunianum TaxID=1367462 RepID=UPI002030CC70|nr:hypothetical protein [Clostridium swellfunianum]MCM0648664.1 hypothetical protein [Clostridium swellfunianum]
MLDRQALEYLVNLGEVKILDVDGKKFSSKELYPVRDPKPSKLIVATLTALVDYLKSNVDKKSSEKLLIHVISPDKVALYSELREDKEREIYMQCEALTPNNIRYNNFMDTESFNIMLQSSFVDNNDKTILLKVTGNVKEENVQQVGDDGVSQAVAIRTGVASVANVVVPNPVTLAPFRTFPEIKQPESKFIFRMQSGPRAALYEADGGAWRNEAMNRIKEYLQDMLVDVENIEIIS